jgi:ATP-dependent DNA helicase RecG
MAENQNIEWKESWRDEYLKWICGFANAKGGKIYIGKNDKGEVVGIAKANRLMDDLPNKIVTHLGVICDINLLEEDKKQFIEIIVEPYPNPVNYKG